MSPATLLGAVDLSTPTQPALPEGASQCAIDEGCNLVVRGGEHQGMKDCLDTIYPYVQRYLELEAAAAEVIQDNRDLVRQQKSLLASNVMLVEKIEDLQRDLAKKPAGD